MRDEPVVVGVVGKPFGVAGEVYVRPDPDLGYDFRPGGAFETSAGVLTVADTRQHRGRTLVRFAEAGDRDAAERLRGVELTVLRSDLSLDEDAFWVGDLLGLEVVDQHGALVGVLEATLDGHAHDYLVVARGDGGEVLVPAVPELIRVEDDRIVVNAIPGLLDGDGGG